MGALGGSGKHLGSPTNQSTWGHPQTSQSTWGQPEHLGTPMVVPNCSLYWRCQMAVTSTNQVLCPNPAKQLKNLLRRKINLSTLSSKRQEIGSWIKCVAVNRSRYEKPRLVYFGYAVNRLLLSGLRKNGSNTVSYTHLTLPTTPYV